MKTGWAMAFGSVFGLLVAGAIVLIFNRPINKHVIELQPLPTPAPLVVYVDGAVQTPGLYTLPPGSRLAEALSAAGGVLPGADLKPLNPARLLEEGERIYVPLEPRAAPTLPATLPARSQSIPQTTGSPEPEDIPTPTSSLININIATQEELESLPRIGPVTAQAIIAYRNTYGPFKTIEELMDVKGIGPATLEALKPYITVGE